MIATPNASKKPAKKPTKKAPPRKAGRTLEAGVGIVLKRTITVDEDTREIIKLFGGGDFSRGIRDAARLLVKRGLVKSCKTTPTPAAHSDCSDLV